MNYSLRIFQGYFTVQLSKFVRCCSATFISYHHKTALSTTFLKYFFAFRNTHWCFLRQLDNNITRIFLCQPNFFSFFRLFWRLFSWSIYVVDKFFSTPNIFDFDFDYFFRITGIKNKKGCLPHKIFVPATNNLFIARFIFLVFIS